MSHPVALLLLIPLFIFSSYSAAYDTRLVDQLDQMGVRHFSRYYLGEDYEWRLFVERQGMSDRLVLLDDDNRAVVDHTQDGLGDLFIDARFFDSPLLKMPVLMSRWRRGVHGEKLVVFDISSGRVLLEQTFAWPFTLVQEGSRMRILYGFPLDNGDVEEREMVWPKDMKKN